jgi:hypothetical protein
MTEALCGGWATVSAEWLAVAVAVLAASRQAPLVAPPDGLCYVSAVAAALGGCDAGNMQSDQNLSPCW